MSFCAHLGASSCLHRMQRRAPNKPPYRRRLRQRVSLFVRRHATRARNFLPAKYPLPASKRSMKLLLASALVALSLGAVQQPAGPIWVIFVDDLHLDFRNTGRLRSLLKMIAAELIHQGESFSMVSTGPSRIAIDVSRDQALLSGGIKNLAGNGLRPDDIIKADPAGLRETTYRATVSLTTACDVITKLEGLPDKRKALVYLSNGYFGDESLRESSTATGAALPGGCRELQAIPTRDQLSAVTSIARRVGVTIFAIDPRTAMGDSNQLEWGPYWAITQRTLQLLSDQTGGFAHLEGTDFAPTLKRIRETVTR
jgi:hypothetical protein